MVTPSLESILFALTGFVAVAILISGLDDFFIDCCYYVSKLKGKLFRPKRASITEADLRRKSEQAIAVMIPAWHEHAVIGKMLSNTLRTVEYRNYEIFVGTYPNDDATISAVEEAAKSDPRVHRIVCPHDGPTNKADCLNWIIAGIRLRDKEARKHVDIFMLQDSEDLIHPLSFKLMNYFIPESSMVQLPVIPLETPLSDLTAGTYLDEFSESHIKDMLVRESLCGMVPSAGVGTGFARAAIDRLSLQYNNQIFNVGTFTEDYDLAFRLNAIGEKSILLQFYVEQTRVVHEGLYGGREKFTRVRELVGTREYFPSRFEDAVRQKARWTLGIVFHGWQQRGWEGGLALRYMIWRDRKTLVTNSVNMLGYLLLLEAGMNAHLGYRGTTDASVVLITADGWMADIFVINAVLLANRCVQRMMTTAQNSTWKQAALSLPRIVWGNIINFCAVAKASYLFVRTALTGRELVWAKTAHAFPSEEQLIGFKRKIGDLMLENQMLTWPHLNHALEVQKKSDRRLGELFVELGYASEADVVKVLGLQLRVETRLIECRDIRPEAMELIPECASREHAMIVLDDQASPVVIAAADLSDRRMNKWLDTNLPCPYRLVLAGRKNLIDVLSKVTQTLREERPVLVANQIGVSEQFHH